MRTEGKASGTIRRLTPQEVCERYPSSITSSVAVTGFTREFNSTPYVELGKGGTGYVLLSQLPTGQKCAMKFIPVSSGDYDAIISDVNDELAIAASLRRQAGSESLLASPTDAFLVVGTGYIILPMPYFAGDTLHEAVRDLSCPMRRASLMAAYKRLCEEWEELSSKVGVLHGDWSPHNIIVGPDKMRIVDLGTACRITNTKTLLEFDVKNRHTSFHPILHGDCANRMAEPDDVVHFLEKADLWAFGVVFLVVFGTPDTRTYTRSFHKQVRQSITLPVRDRTKRFTVILLQLADTIRTDPNFGDGDIEWLLSTLARAMQTREVHPRDTIDGSSVAPTKRPRLE